MSPIRLLLVLLLSTLPLAAGAQTVDRAEMEATEDLSESLANDLLKLSVDTRNRDMAEVATFFAERLRATPFPAEAKALERRVKWVQSRGWVYGTKPISISRAQFLTAWGRFFDNFTEIEDVRFKVKQATFDDAQRGQARVFFFIVARDTEGRREWVRGWINVEAAHPGAGDDARWQIEHFALEEMSSLVADVDLFSEVSLPAGVARTIPRYGTPGNEGFAWNGAAAADVDNDGDIDIFATGVEHNDLYLNDDGRFTVAEDDVGLLYLPGEAAGALFIDYDNDGDSDLFLSSVGNQMLFENRMVPDGSLYFNDVSIESGVDMAAIGFSAVAGDVNGDGLPDIYVTSYNRYGTIMPNSWSEATNGTRNLLFVNQGSGRFKEMARELGVGDTRWSYAAQFVDYDEDGDQDLYVANDFGTNALYVNEGGRFTDLAETCGVLDPGNGMGVSFSDYDNDGDLDLHVTNMSSTAGNRIVKRIFPEASDPDAGVLLKLAAGNSLYENLGDGTFKDVSKAAGGFSGGWAWGGGFLDFDNDGWEDIFTPNGFISGKSMKDT